MSRSIHLALTIAVTAVLAALIYVQVSDYLPEGLQRPSATTSVRQENPACALAEVPRDHALVAASVWEGGVPTDLVIGNPSTVLKIVRVNVDEGDKPITVFLSGYHVVWDFAGAVERIARVVAMSPVIEHRIGVAGIPADRVDFPARGDCGLFQDVMTGEATARAKGLAVMFGRRPDADVRQQKAVQLSLPAASFEIRPEDTTVRRGQRNLEPAQIVSKLPITRPALLPGEDGIRQLESAGVLREPTKEEIEQFVVGVSSPYRSSLSPDFRIAVTFDYVVTREATLPVPPVMKEWRFLVLPGVPVPRINGRACIAQMDGFRVNDLRACYRGAYEGIEQLDRFPPLEKLADCRVTEVPKEAAIEAVSAYEPGQANRSLNAKRTPYPIDVRVEKPGDVFLVLNSYEPAVWRVAAAAETRIAGVLLGGHHPSTLEGIAPETPVVNAELETRGNRPKPTTACAPLQFWNYGAYRGGPDALVFDRHVTALTGRHIDGLHGDYSLTAVTIR